MEQSAVPQISGGNSELEAVLAFAKSLAKSVETIAQQVEYLYSWHKDEADALGGFGEQMDFDRALLAAVLGVDKTTVRYWIASKKLNVPSGARLIPYSEVMRAIKDGSIAPTALKKLEYAERMSLVNRGRWAQIKGEIKRKKQTR